MAAPRSAAATWASWPTTRALLSSSTTRSICDRAAERRVARLGLPSRPLVLLRVTPGIEAHTHEYVRTGQEDSKFGLGLASGGAGEAVRRLRRPRSPVDLIGVHAHIGSQIFAVSSFERAVELLAGFFVPLDLPELNLGGGLGVAYVEGE